MTNTDVQFMPLDLDHQLQFNTKICVVGIGGAGGNAVNNMIRRGIEGVTFITANTDLQALDKTLASEKILLGPKLRKGLGAAGRPEIGKKAAEESLDIIKTALVDYDMVFIASGMGGGTGTGASPVIAKLAKELGALVVGIIVKCFSQEGASKAQLAERGITTLKEYLDAVIVIDNDKISEIYGNIPFREAAAKTDDVLYNALYGITDIVMNDFDINIDFADVREVLTNAGEVIIGIGSSKGENAGREAVNHALKSPFFNELVMKNATKILLNIQAGHNFTAEQIDEAYLTLRETAGGDPDMIVGGTCNDDDDFRVTIIATSSKKNIISETLISETVNSRGVEYTSFLRQSK
jgi:cell division protein FtsZ